MTIANSVLLMHDVSFEAISFACPSGLGANLLSTLYKSSSSLGKKQKKKTHHVMVEDFRLTLISGQKEMTS